MPRSKVRKSTQTTGARFNESDIYTGVDADKSIAIPKAYKSTLSAQLSDDRKKTCYFSLAPAAFTFLNNNRVSFQTEKRLYTQTSLFVISVSPSPTLPAHPPPRPLSSHSVCS